MMELLNEISLGSSWFASNEFHLVLLTGVIIMGLWAHFDN